METAMRKLLTFLIALGAIVFAVVSQVFAFGYGFQGGCGGGYNSAGGFSGGGCGAAPFVHFASSNGSTTAGTSFTFSSQGIGTADPNRLVVVCIGGGPGSGAFTVTGVTIGGNAAAHVSGASAYDSGGGLSDIWYLAVPTGTTATIAVTFSQSLTRSSIAVYSVTGPGVAVSAGFNNAISLSGNSIAKAVTGIPSGGGTIAAAYLHTATAGTITQTNLSNDTGSVVAGSSTMVSGNNTSLSGSQTFTTAWAGTATDSAMSVVTFSP